MMETRDTDNDIPHPDESVPEPDPAAAGADQSEGAMIDEVEKLTVAGSLRRQAVLMAMDRLHRENRMKRVRQGLSHIYRTVHMPHHRHRG